MAIGKAIIKDFQVFNTWLRNEGKCWGYKNGIWNADTREKRNIASNLYEESEHNVYTTIGPKWPTSNEKQTDQFQEIYEFALKYGISFEVMESTDDYTILRFGKKQYILPSEFVEVELFADYSDMTLGQLKGISGPQGKFQLARLDEDLTISGAKVQIEESKTELEQLKDQVKNLEEEKKLELERIQAEIMEKYREREAALQKLQEETKQKMAALQNQMFLLTTEIYAIQCFLGETVTFTKLRDGKPAATEEPVILYQRMRYLDEELARMISLYDIRESDISLFESFIQSCDYAAEHFAPGEKSISLVRLTKSETGFTRHDNFLNMLQKYEIYHGNIIGILVRNGENVYIGWTDSDRIDIEDENIYYAPKRTEHVISEEYGEPKVKSVTKEEVASRYFIFSILQGIIHSGKILRIPEEELFMKGGGRYIIFSMADGYLEDNRFGLFADIMDRCNTNIQKGDSILCVQYLRAEQPKHYYAYSNDRGRGDRNRTHDVNTENNKIYQINLVEEERKPMVYYKSRYRNPRTGQWEYENYRTEGTLKDHSFDEERVTDIEERIDIIHHYFVSLRKKYSASGTSRANFEIWSDEFINLTFLNSVWIRYAIQNRKVGAWRIGGEEVSYAYSMRYLNKALEHIEEREKEEYNLISQYMDMPEEWQVALSEWKLEKNVHSITDYQAKRFAKYCMHNDK